MSNVLKYLVPIGLIIVLIIWWVVGFYNGVIGLNEKVEGQWAQVENQFQRRFELIPNLVNSVKGAMAQEEEIFLAIAEARTKYTGAETVNEKAEAATQVESALGRLLAIFENYPELKSVDTVQTLMTQLEGTENRLSVERMRFNEYVKEYNVKIKVMPNNILAGFFGFTPKNFFEAAEGAEVAPVVDLEN